MAYTTIKKPSDYFNTVLWTGTGTDNTAITGANFSPDFVWIKHRTDGTSSHHTADSVNGALYRMRTDTSGALSSQPDGVKSFDSDGITLGTTGSINQSGNPFVGWFWRGSDSSAVTNNDGSISSTVSTNTTSGFSIVSYTGNGTSGATVGHGLGSAPKMFIVKDTTAAYPWRCWHYGLDNGAGTHEIYLNTTAASGASSDAWNNTAPTSSVFSLGNGNYSNGSGDNFIAYCFAEKKGFSKFGSYTGNGNADGTFVYTGFKPAFLIVKRTDAINNWTMYDNKRNNSFNEITHTLIANASDAEATSTTDDDCDFLSNGVKMRCSNNGSNGSGANYVFMAFAEEPLVGDNPTTAR